jgi:hypothetical protein
VIQAQRIPSQGGASPLYSTVSPLHPMSSLDPEPSLASGGFQGTQDRKYQQTLGQLLRMTPNDSRYLVSR